MTKDCGTLQRREFTKGPIVNMSNQCSSIYFVKYACPEVCIGKRKTRAWVFPKWNDSRIMAMSCGLFASMIVTSREYGEEALHRRMASIKGQASP